MMSKLEEIKKGVEACRTYNFGMRYADKLAHEDADKLVAALEKFQAWADTLDEHAEILDLDPERVADHIRKIITEALA